MAYPARDAFRLGLAVALSCLGGVFLLINWVRDTFIEPGDLRNRVLVTLCAVPLSALCYTLGYLAGRSYYRRTVRRENIEP